MAVGRLLIIGLAACITAGTADAQAQEVAERDLVLEPGPGPMRLMGYGLVTGLSGTGDRVNGAAGARHTVRSIANLLRRFDVEVPDELLNTRNVAAVLVTAEVSPYLRRGGRFDVSVSSLGDAQSLTGGVLWMTPLVAEAGGTALASAQGSILTPTFTPTLGGRTSRGPTSGQVRAGGAVETELSRPGAAYDPHLQLRQPDIGTALRVVAAIDSALGGGGNASVVDPGSILLTPKDTSRGMASLLASVREIRIRTSTVARVVIDANDGTVVAGADIRVAATVVSYEGLTVFVGENGEVSAPPPGLIRAPDGSTVSDVVRALRTAGASAAQTAHILTALHDAGALTAVVVVR